MNPPSNSKTNKEQKLKITEVKYVPQLVFKTTSPILFIKMRNKMQRIIYREGRSPEYLSIKKLVSSSPDFEPDTDLKAKKSIIRCKTYNKNHK